MRYGFAYHALGVALVLVSACSKLDAVSKGLASKEKEEAKEEKEGREHTPSEQGDSDKSDVTLSECEEASKEWERLSGYKPPRPANDYERGVRHDIILTWLRSGYPVATILELVADLGDPNGLTSDKRAADLIWISEILFEETRSLCKPLLEAALRALKESETDPLRFKTNRNAYKKIAELYRKGGDKGRADEVFSIFIEAYAGGPTLDDDAAVFYAKLGDEDKARQHFKGRKACEDNKCKRALLEAETWLYRHKNPDTLCEPCLAPIKEMLSTVGLSTDQSLSLAAEVLIWNAVESDLGHAQRLLDLVDPQLNRAIPGAVLCLAEAYQGKRLAVDQELLDFLTRYADLEMGPPPHQPDLCLPLKMEQLFFSLGVYGQVDTAIKLAQKPLLAGAHAAVGHLSIFLMGAAFTPLSKEDEAKILDAMWPVSAEKDYSAQRKQSQEWMERARANAAKVKKSYWRASRGTVSEIELLAVTGEVDQVMAKIEAAQVLDGPDGIQNSRTSNTCGLVRNAAIGAAGAGDYDFLRKVLGSLDAHGGAACSITPASSVE